LGEFVSDTNTQEQTGTQVSELDMLKKRADVMGVKYSNNIGLEALRARVEAKMNGEPDPTPTDQPNPFEDGNELASDVPETKMQIRARLQKEALKLVRCRIANLDPKKKDLKGEIITVGNEFIGTIKKYVPFGEITDNGWHVPQIIYDELNSRRFLNIRVTKKNGREHIEQNMSKEFALEVLDQLTPQELARLAAAQAAGGNVD
jgi:hypothetical protein